MSALLAQLDTPRGVFVAPNGEVYIADSANDRIRKILLNGNIVTIAGTGEGEYNGDNIAATMANVNYPQSVFVSSDNEVYIADTSNHRIRKILKNGNIVTIAGNGERGYNGDNILATMANLNYPQSVFVSSEDEVYIADTDNHRIRKILRNDIILKVAGTGECGYDSDDENGPAVDSHFNTPQSVFVSSDDEVYIADTENHRIRKILKNGTIITIAGTGECGYSGDSKFDFLLYPHIGGNVYSKKFKIQFQQHSRDLLFNTSIYAFIPLLEILSPLFCTCILKNELNLIQMSFTTQFIESLTIGNLSVKWEKVDHYLTLCRNELRLGNYILELLNNYCIEFAAIQLKTPGGVNSLPSFPIVAKYAAIIASKQTLFQPNSIIIDEKVEIEPTDIETLYNDEKTSDLKIEIGQEKYLYCHKTILSSSSTLFNAMLNSGSTFTDLNNDIFIPDSDDDLELLQIIVKSCYQIQIEDVEDEKLISLLDMAIKHEILDVIEYCKNEIY